MGYEAERAEADWYAGLGFTQCKPKWSVRDEAYGRSILRAEWRPKGHYEPAKLYKFTTDHLESIKQFLVDHHVMFFLRSLHDKGYDNAMGASNTALTVAMRQNPLDVVLHSALYTGIEQVLQLRKEKTRLTTHTPRKPVPVKAFAKKDKNERVLYDVEVGEARIGDTIIIWDPNLLREDAWLVYSVHTDKYVWLSLLRSYKACSLEKSTIVKKIIRRRG